MELKRHNEEEPDRAFYIPFLAGYWYELQDLDPRFAGLGFKQYRSTPTEPALMVLTNDHEFRQVTTGFTMEHTGSRDTVPYRSGHVDSGSIVAVPHTGMFDDIDFTVETAKAKVQTIGCICFSLIVCCRLSSKRQRLRSISANF